MIYINNSFGMTRNYLVSIVFIYYMKNIINHYIKWTENNDKSSLKYNGQSINKYYSKKGGKKWSVYEGCDPIFDNVGKLNGTSEILVGKINNEYYPVYLNGRKSKIIGNITNYEIYSSSRFMWVESDRSELDNTCINKIGKYLVHLKTGVYCSCDKPLKEKKLGKRFQKDKDTVIEWDGQNFREIDKSDNIQKEVISKKDLRKEQFEEFLEDNIKINIPSNSDYINEVDHSETPEPMAYVFYRMSNGDFPEDNNGEFEPPKQNEYAEYAYNYFKENSDDETEIFDEKYKEAWMQRLKNTWASLIRDVHFSFMMFKRQKENNPFNDVEFDVEKDVEEGVDFIVEEDEKEYHINLFVNSKKSQEFVNKKKKNRHPDKEDNVIEIEVPLDIDGEKKEINTSGSDLWLFSDKHVNAIENLIKNDKTVVYHNGEVLCRVMNNY